MSRRRGRVKIRRADVADIDTLPKWFAMAGYSSSQEGVDFLSAALLSGVLSSALEVSAARRRRVFAEQYCVGPLEAIAARTTAQMLTVDGLVVGCAILGPSVTMMDKLEQHSQDLFMLASVHLTKLNVLAVDDAHRGFGHGQRLVGRALEVARTSDVSTVYGEFNCVERPALADFYSGCGFTVCAPGEGINAGDRLGVRGLPLTPPEGERMFYRNVQQRVPTRY